MLRALAPKVQTRAPEPDEDSPLDGLFVVAQWTERAAAEFTWAGGWQAPADVSSAVHHVRHARVPVETPIDDLARHVWALGAVKVATGAFLDSWSHAERARPRLVRTWMGADRGADHKGWETSRQAAAMAMIQEPDAARCWDVALGAAQAAAPEYWAVVLAALEEQFPDGAIEDGWDAARERMARVHPEVHLAGGLAAAAVPAAAVCELVAASDRTDVERLVEVLWTDVDVLITRLGSTNARAFM